MSGGTGVVPTGRVRALPVCSAESRSGVGTAFQQPWPLQSHLPLGAQPTAPACARGHTGAVLREWGLGHLVEDAELLVSELVTNAVRASDRLRVRADLAIVPAIQLWLVSDLISLVIHVWDGNDEMPVRRNSGPDDESGWGLMLVESLSSEWGAYRKKPGKTVWCKLDSLHSQPARGWT